MSTKHTPGPWVDRGGMPALITNSGGALIAKPLAHGNQTVDEYRANTSLIAAAPELLEALQTIADSEEFNGDSFVCDFQTLQGVARAAIAKATQS